MTWKLATVCFGLTILVTLAFVVSYAPAVAFAAESAAAPSNTLQASNEKYPLFSGDRVPLWLRVRKKTAYSEQELAQIAKYPLVVFEKANGHETYGDVESGTLAAAKGVKKISPNTKVIFYFNAVIEYGNYRANEEFDRHAGTWALHKDGTGFKFKDKYNLFDLAQASVRDWWVATAKGMVDHSEIDGVFIDAICKTTGYGDAYASGYWEMANMLRRNLPQNKLLLGNAVRVAQPNWNLDHLKYLDGTYVERWAIPMNGETYEDYVAKSIEAMEKTVEQNKLLLFSAGPGAYGREGRIPGKGGPAEMRRWMREHISYPLAIFLIVAGEHSFFEWGDSPDALEGALENHDYPEYHKPLGKPLGKAQRDGYVYTRQYQHVDVQVDIKNKAADLRWH